MSAIRPLRRTQEWAFRSGSYYAQTVPQYGDQTYHTVDRELAISYCFGSWRVSRGPKQGDLFAHVKAAGIVDACFPRRRDAIEALEYVAAGVT